VDDDSDEKGLKSGQPSSFGGDSNRSTDRDHLRSVYNPELGVSTGMNFQNKIEDDLYEKPETPTPEDPWSKWIGRGCWAAVGLTVVNFLAILCYQGWQWVRP